ncbi:hypothetical protein CQW23_35308, partial [Capsicum baccatum]
MGSSSLVEEERTYGISWHLLSFRKLMQHIVTRTEKNTSATVDSKTNNYIHICSILVILISGRILGGWHQGGVNWTNLPDISKWLEQMGSTYIKLFQLVSVIILINISLVSLMWSRRSKKNFMTVISLMHLFPGWLVLHYITKYQDVAFSTAIVAAACELNACTISLRVAALYYMGMAGHFGLGNTNTLATIDVAGAFIGVLNHSTVLSGVLMFIITYASPMLYLLSMVMYNSVKDTSGFIIFQDGNIDSLLKRTLGFPCLVPLGLNSILLIAYTIVLLLMRNHLFVWSVFSP